VREVRTTQERPRRLTPEGSADEVAKRAGGEASGGIEQPADNGPIEHP
jgi:hypothetical protein